jgi:hypothetical protein
MFWKTVGGVTVVIALSACGEANRNGVASGGAAIVATGGPDGEASGSTGGRLEGGGGSNGKGSESSGATRGSVTGGVVSTAGSGSTSGASAAGEGSIGGGGSAGNGGSTGGNGPVSPPANAIAITSLAHGQDQWIAVGTVHRVADYSYDGGFIYSSPNGREWRLLVRDLPTVLTSVRYGNGVFVATGNDPASNRSVAYVSEDGSQFEAVTLPLDSMDPSFAFGNGVFLGISSRYAKALRSANGRSWEALPLPGIASNRVPSPRPVRGAWFAAGTFAAFTINADQSLHVSPSGDNWKTIDVSGSDSNWLMDLWVDEGRFVASTQYQCCFGETGGPWPGRAESKDGLTWTHQTNTTAWMFENLRPLPTSDFSPVYTEEAEGVRLLAGIGGIFLRTGAQTWQSVLSTLP